MVVKVAMPQQFKLKVVPIGDRTGNRGDQKTRIRI